MEANLKQELDNLTLDDYNKVGVLYDPETKKHYHSFESQERAHSIIQNFVQKDLIKNPNIEYISKITPATLIQVQAVHTEQQLTEFYKLPEETKTAAFLAAGSTIMAADKIMKKEWKSAFCVIRPPGHHMGVKSLPENGFCFLNNIVICAKYLKSQYNVKKIAIIDWDIHFGDGTHSYVSDDPDMLFISLHEYDKGYFYPGTGSADNLGKRKGYCINIPWNISDYCPGNEEYIYAFERLILPILKNYSPEVILVSAGYDSAKNDPLGNAVLTKDGFWYMTQQLMKIVNNEKIILILEGGYNLNSIQWAAEASLRALLHQDATILNESNKNIQEMINSISPNDCVFQAMNECLIIQKNYWPFLTQDQNLLNYQNLVLENVIKKTNLYIKENLIVVDDKCHKIYNEEEFKFYSQLQNQDEKNVLLNKQFIEKYILKFFGKIVQQEKEYISIENIYLNKQKYDIIEFIFYSDIFTKQYKQKAVLQDFYKINITTYKDQLNPFDIGFHVLSYRKFQFASNLNEINQQYGIDRFFFDFNTFQYNHKALQELLAIINSLLQLLEEQQKQLSLNSFILLAMIDSQNANHFEFKLIPNQITLSQSNTEENEKIENTYENMKVGLQNLQRIIQLIE